jgi:putative chitinase
MTVPPLSVELFRLCTGASVIAAGPREVVAADEACALYDINTARRVGMFLANVGHETGGLRFLSELWGPTDAQRRYDTKPDLGNLYLGDGFKYRGRGWLQTTGRANYLRLTQRLRARWPSLQVPDFVAQSDLLASPRWAAISAADYVDMRSLNHVADSDNFDAYCDIINLGRATPRYGDSNGWQHRLQLWQVAKPALILAGFPV